MEKYKNVVIAQILTNLTHIVFICVGVSPTDSRQHRSRGCERSSVHLRDCFWLHRQLPFRPRGKHVQLWWQHQWVHSFLPHPVLLFASPFSYSLIPFLPTIPPFPLYWCNLQTVSPVNWMLNVDYSLFNVKGIFRKTMHTVYVNHVAFYNNDFLCGHKYMFLIDYIFCETI